MIENYYNTIGILLRDECVTSSPSMLCCSGGACEIENEMVVSFYCLFSLSSNMVSEVGSLGILTDILSILTQ